MFVQWKTITKSTAVVACVAILATTAHAEPSELSVGAHISPEKGLQGSFAPRESEGWSALGSDLWERRQGDLTERFSRGDAAASAALAGIESERRRLLAGRSVQELSVGEDIELAKLDLAASGFRQALIADPSRRGLAKTIVQTDSGVACSGEFNLRIEFAPGSFYYSPSASATASWMPIQEPPFGPINPPSNLYTYTIAWVSMSDGRYASASNIDDTIGPHGLHSMSTASVYLPQAASCTANAEAYFVCGQTIYGYSTTRRRVDCNDI